MICRHSNGDPSCTSGKAELEPTDGRWLGYRERVITQYVESQKPDSKNYDIQQMERVGPHLVLKVLYPSCSKCAYEGNKVMVFLNIGELDVIKWKEIDPHFRPDLIEIDPMNKMKRIVKDPKKAPSPAARFPANEEGWKDAIEYAKTKPPTGG